MARPGFASGGFFCSRNPLVKQAYRSCMTKEKEDTMIGKLAFEVSAEAAKVQPLQSGAGWYLGTLDEDGLPLSRESVEYFASESEATRALESGAWTQRLHP